MGHCRTGASSPASASSPSMKWSLNISLPAGQKQQQCEHVHNWSPLLPQTEKKTHRRERWTVRLRVTTQSPPFSLLIVVECIFLLRINSVGHCLFGSASLLAGFWQAVKLLPKTAYWRLDKQWGEWEPNTTCRYGHHVLKVPANWGQRRTSPRRRVGRNRLDAIIFGQCDERRRRSRRQLSKVLWISTWVNCCFSPHIHLTAGMAFQSQVKDKLKEQGGAFVLSCAIIVIFPPQGTAPLASICFFSLQIHS